MEVQQAARIKLTDLIAPAFYKVHKDIKEGRHETITFTEDEDQESPLLCL